MFFWSKKFVIMSKFMCLDNVINSKDSVPSQVSMLVLLISSLGNSAWIP